MYWNASFLRRILFLSQHCWFWGWWSSRTSTENWHFRNMSSVGAQSGECLILAQVMISWIVSSSPTLGLLVSVYQRGACLRSSASLSLSPSLCPSPVCTLPKVNKYLKNKNLETWVKWTVGYCPKYLRNDCAWLSMKSQKRTGYHSWFLEFETAIA